MEDFGSCHIKAFLGANIFTQWCNFFFSKANFIYKERSLQRTFIFITPHLWYIMFQREKAVMLWKWELPLYITIISQLLPKQNYQPSLQNKRAFKSNINCGVHHLTDIRHTHWGLFPFSEAFDFEAEKISLTMEEIEESFDVVSQCLRSIKYPSDYFRKRCFESMESNIISAGIFHGVMYIKRVDCLQLTLSMMRLETAGGTSLEAMHRYAPIWLLWTFLRTITSPRYLFTAIQIRWSIFKQSQLSYLVPTDPLSVIVEKRLGSKSDLLTPILMHTRKFAYSPP